MDIRRQRPLREKAGRASGNACQGPGDLTPKQEHGRLTDAAREFDRTQRDGGEDQTDPDGKTGSDQTVSSGVTAGGGGAHVSPSLAEPAPDVELAAARRGSW